MEDDKNNFSFCVNKKSIFSLFCILTLLVSFYFNLNAFAAEAGKKDSQEQQQLQALRQKQEKINNLYHQAKVAYSEQNFDQAEKIFNQVLDIDPEHSASQIYLNRYIPNRRQDLKEAAQREKERRAELARKKAQEQKREKIDGLYREVKSAYSKENFTQAESLCKDILNLDVGHAAAKKYLNTYIPNRKEELREAAQRKREHQRRLAEQKRQRKAREKKLEAQRKKQEKIDNLYREAKSAYANDKLDKAETVFKKILKVDSEHRASQTYLNRYIPNRRQDLKEAAQREKVNNLYHNAKVYYTERKLDTAKAAFYRVLDEDSTHRGAKAYLKKIEIIKNKRKQREE